MKILIIHYRYSIIGGPERYLFNVKDLLESKGHEVIPFSFDYPENEKSEYSNYFVHPVSREFHAHKLKKLSSKALLTGLNILYNKSAFDKLSELLIQQKPDIAYVLLYWKLSISIFKALKKNKIPIVLRISDFVYFCSRGTFSINGTICEKCTKNSLNRVYKKCTNGSLMLSSVDYLRREFEKKSGAFKLINELVIPSQFTLKYYQENPIFQNAKLNLVPTFYNSNNYESTESDYRKRFENKHILYFGRISREKGIELLVEAFKHYTLENNILISLSIIGFDNSHYSDLIKSKIKDFNSNKIITYGFLSKPDLIAKLKSATYIVIPSIWYENMPNTLIESQRLGIPTIASNIGSLKELIKEDYNGFLFDKFDVDELKMSIKKSFNKSLEEYIELCRNAKSWSEKYCSPDAHYQKLISIFNKYVE